MKAFVYRATLLKMALLVGLTLAPVLRAQNTPRIGYVYPAGGQQGTTFQVVLGGQFLASATNIYVTGSGVQGTVLEYNRPLTQKEFTDLREKLKELQAKRAAALKTTVRRGKRDKAAASTNTWTAADDKALAEIRKKLMNPPNRNGNPAIAETVSLKVTMSPEAEPGQREIRVATALGLSNPLVFHVGQLHEFSKAPAKTMPVGKNGNETKYNRFVQNQPLPADPHITLPSMINGQIMPGTVDRFKFTAQKGQHLVVAASARELIPYLPDAVPGWFQATIAIYDNKGHELAYADDFRFHPDPALFYEVPRDGEYVLEIRDAIYRGREDFVYRVAVSELPFITSIFPLGAQAGTEAKVELTGWNLQSKELTVDCKQKAPGVYPVSLGQKDKISNHLPFAVDTLPECLEQEPNNEVASAQTIALPITINGRIHQPGDWDVFRFEGRAGSTVVAEVYARRLDSPLDSLLKLTDATGRQLALNDDCEDKGCGLNTHHADSRLSVTLSADGTYYLHLGDTQHKGGPEYAYRVRVSEPRPDFELRLVPASITARSGASAPITVYALRKDGFTNEIVLSLKDAPKGFALSGGWVPAGQDQVRLTLTAGATAGNEPVTLQMEGRAKIQGHDVVRSAVPAEDMMQAFAYRHLVPANEFKVAVTGRGMGRAAARVLGETPIKIHASGTTRIQIAAPKGPLGGQARLELSDPPEGLSISSVSPSRDGAELVLQSDPAKVKPGLKGNLLVTAFAPRGALLGKAKTQGNPRPLATLPAIPYEIVP